MKRICISLSAWLIVITINAQVGRDSPLIPEKNWVRIPVCDGIVIKSVTTHLFNSTQSIYVAEIDTTMNEFEFGVAVPDALLPTSIIARNINAVLAINGTFFNMKIGNNRHFIRIDYKVVASTEEKEFDTRATAVVTSTGEKIDISSWSREKEMNYPAVAEDILVSGPLMIDDDIDITLWDNTFATSRHPRSFIGLTKDGKVLFVVVDGRQPGYADGMSLYELRILSRALGCTDAMNLDGGGSTTLYVNGQNRKGVVNKPSDPIERPVASILYIKALK